MTNISDELNRDFCTGCAACFNACPVNAISMSENNEGFLEPVIDNDKCTNCGLCSKTCPVINSKYENKNKPDCYAYMAPDEIRKHSSSGGAFYTLAKQFIANGGYVAGAIWNDSYNVLHVVSNKMDDVERMRSSKYIQSSVNDCYSQVKEILNKNKRVLFTGTPCQIAGLKSYLSKDYKNLFCVELICHGAPSPKVFRKYIEEEILINKDEKWISTDFRDKNYGWGSGFTTTTTTTTVTTIAKPAVEDTFMQAFCKDICLRKSCSSCSFNKIPRQGDITIGDLWSIRHVKNFRKKYCDDRGTSLVLSNSKKGKVLVKILSNEKKILSRIPLKKALLGNPNLFSSTCAHNKRDEFFSLIDKMTLKENVDRNINDKCDCMILNFWSAVNYGAILTCYGVQCLIEQLGYYPKVINYIGYPKSVNCKDFQKSFSYKFAKKYLNLTNEVKTYEDFYKLNKNCDTFIAGSDQVWRKSCSEGVLNEQLYWTTFFLDFVRSGKRKISYAPSFGTSEIDGTQYDYETMNYYLSQFDAISVREDKGKELLKDNFDIDSTQIIDGIVHIPMEKLNKMTEVYKTDEKYIACFSLPYFTNQNWYKEILSNISKKLNIPIKEFKFEYRTPVEEWLAYIKNAEFVITDSYHGTLTSILFNIPFIQIKNATKVQSRFDTIFRCLNISNRTVSEFDTNIDYSELLRPFDWVTINQNIENERIKAKEWTLEAMQKEIDKKIICPNFIEETKQRLVLLTNKSMIKRRYLRAKILSFIIIGKKRKHYKELKQKLKLQVRKIRELSK